MANRHSGLFGGVILARLACHRCVGSQVLCICRFRNLEGGKGGSFSWFLRILGRGRCVKGFSALSPVFVPFAIIFRRRVLAARSRKRFAVSARSRARVEVGFRRLGCTMGVLSSAISFLARACSRRGTLRGLWLAVRRRSPRGTCWKARELPTALDVAMLCSRERISNSWAATKACRSSSPSLRADCAGSTGMLRARWTLARRAAWGLSLRPPEDALPGFLLPCPGPPGPAGACLLPMACGEALAREDGRRGIELPTF